MGTFSLSVSFLDNYSCNSSALVKPDQPSSVLNGWHFLFCFIFLFLFPFSTINRSLCILSCLFHCFLCWHLEMRLFANQPFQRLRRRSFAFSLLRNVPSSFLLSLRPAPPTRLLPFAKKPKISSELDISGSLLSICLGDRHFELPWERQRLKRARSSLSLSFTLVCVSKANANSILPQFFATLRYKILFSA